MAPFGPDDPVIPNAEFQENVEVNEPEVIPDGTAEFLEASIVMETE